MRIQARQQREVMELRKLQRAWPPARLETRLTSGEKTPWNPPAWINTAEEPQKLKIWRDHLSHAFSISFPDKGLCTGTHCRSQTQNRSPLFWDNLSCYEIVSVLLAAESCSFTPISQKCRASPSLADTGWYQRQALISHLTHATMSIKVHMFWPATSTCSAS